ncbi:MAG: VWA domain-containing protein [Ignavibacteriales bacterium]|nr:VWA domain-containing protein [Ignavibacteriales bacterium]
MSIAFPIPWYLVLPAMLAGIGFSLFMYRITVPPVSSARRAILVALRAVGLMLLILAICEPLLTIRRTVTERPVVAVMVDNSLSMTLTDAAGNREQTLRSLLKNPALTQLSASADIRFFSITPKVQPLQPDLLQCTGTATDIAGALESLKRRPEEHTSAVLLLSDGNYNVGGNPVTGAERSRIPVFTVSIGDSSEQKDISVASINTNSIAYLKSAVPMDVTIRSSGFRKKIVAVQLLEEGKTIVSEPLLLSDSSGSSADQTVHFSFTPMDEGLRKYTVHVAPLDGEVTTKNNSRSVIVRVLKNRMKLLLLAGAPSADISALEQALHHDANIESSLFVQQPDGSLRAQPGTAATFATALAETECLLLAGFPSGPTPPPMISSLLQNAADRSLPLFLVLSRTIDYQKLKLMERLLPVTIPMVQMAEQTVFTNIPKTMMQHQLLTDGAEFGAWEKFPPLYAPVTGFTPKPEALVLATWRIQNVPIAAPLIALRSIGQAKSFAVLGYGLYRWRLLAGADNDAFFDKWISTLIRWLVTRENGSTLRIQPAAEYFSSGDNAAFSIEAYNQSYQPLDNADIQLDIEHIASGRKFQATIRPFGGGRYEGVVDMLPEGNFRYSGVATLKGTKTGSSTGRFSVGEQSAEFNDTRMNNTLLQQMAAVSGGAYADAGGFSALLRDLASRPFMKSEQRLSVHEYELWNMPLVLSLIVLLFGTEWIIRKRSGML